MMIRPWSFFITAAIAFTFFSAMSLRPALSAMKSIAGSDVKTLIVGLPLSIELPEQARDVIVGDPTLVDSILTSGRRLVLTGRAQGITTLSINDPNGALISMIALHIEANLDDLNEIISRDMNIKTVNVRSVKQAVVISGTVASPDEASRVEDLVRAYFGNGSGGAKSSTSSFNIINTLKITDRQQVMLRVVVSEVQRSLLKQLGVDTQGNWSIGNFTLANSVTFATARTPTASFSPGIKNNDGNSSATLKALERAGYLKTLAEPTLTAISGESAKFTAGGEIPVPTGDICTTNAVGSQSCQTNYGYKPIGVSLAFTPVVVTSGRISLHVNTEVTELDPDNGSRTNSGNIPAFRSRKMETTVELASGAALMSAGLIQHQSSATFDRVPGIGDVPVLGQLFQSNDYQNHQTELLISVVPYIAKPYGALEPDSSENDYLTPSSAQTNLINEISNLYGIRSRIPPARIGFEVR